MTDQWNQFITDNACPNYISMNFNKIGTRTTSQQTQSKHPCKKPGHWGARADHELLMFIEQDYKKQRERAMIENEAFLDEIEDIMDSMPCTQPGFDPSGLFTPVWTQDDDHTSILAYDSDRTISYQSPDVHSYLMSCMSENTTDSYDSHGHDVSVELTPDTPCRLRTSPVLYKNFIHVIEHVVL